MEYKKATEQEVGDIRIPQTGNQKITVDDIIMKKATGNKITMITSYDYCMAKICDVANVDIILVGDSASYGDDGIRNYQIDYNGRNANFL